MIRRMEERDIPEVAELERICFSECWSARILESGIHSPYDVYYVFEQDERILGYCNLRVLAGEGEVQRIAVRPDSRRYGVGRKMMDAMVEYAVREGACAMSLEVREGNTAARNLYEPTVLYRKQFESLITITRRRMHSSCGSEICRKELPLKIVNISVYNVGDAAAGRISCFVSRECPEM